MNTNSENTNPQNEADKLNAIANIISAGGGVLGEVSGFFNKSPNTFEASPAVVEKQEVNKKKTNQLLIYGGGALLLIVVLIMFKK